MDENFLQNRAERLRQVTEAADLVDQYKLLSVMRLNTSLYDELVHNVQNYIIASLRVFNPGNQYESSANMLRDYEAEIVKLPNRTSNGKLAAKEEVAKEFNAVQVSMEKLINSLNVRRHFSFMQLPVIVRIQQGLMDGAVDGRCYATSKLHSDIWTGEPANSGTLIVPIMGDMENIGLEFNEPSIKTYEKFVKTYNDYKDTESFLGVLNRYDVVMQPERLYFFDSYCVHRTIKKRAGLRVSIDFRVMFKEELPSDSKVDIKRLSNYCEADTWFTAERGVRLIPNATVQQTIEALKKDTFSEGYDLTKEFRQVSNEHDHSQRT